MPVAKTGWWRNSSPRNCSTSGRSSITSPPVFAGRGAVSRPRGRGGRWAGPRTGAPATGGCAARQGLIAPGFEDAHLHFRMGAVSLLQVDLQPAESVADLRGILDRWQRSHPDAEWIVGRGWQYGVFPGGMPDRHLLDELRPDRPAR